MIEACITSRANDGGLTELGEIMKRIKVMRGAPSNNSKKGNTQQQITEDDMVRAIKTLKPLNGGYEVLQIGDKKLVRSVPKELDKDQSMLLLLAQKTGYITYEMIQLELGWGQERMDTAVVCIILNMQHIKIICLLYKQNRLLQDELAWIDSYEGVDTYWIPSYFMSRSIE